MAGSRKKLRRGPSARTHLFSRSDETTERTTLSGETGRACFMKDMEQLCVQKILETGKLSLRGNHGLGGETAPQCHKSKFYPDSG